MASEETKQKYRKLYLSKVPDENRQSYFTLSGVHTECYIKL